MLMHTKRNICAITKRDISTLEGTPLKLVDKFTYLGSSVESTEKDIETRLTKAWTAINRLSIIYQAFFRKKNPMLWWRLQIWPIGIMQLRIRKKTAGVLSWHHCCVYLWQGLIHWDSCIRAVPFQRVLHV